MPNLYFLKIDGVKGESVANGQKEEIELTAFNLMAAQVGDQPRMGQLACTAISSKADPKLWSLQFDQEKSIPEVVLTCRAGASLDYGTWKFTNCKLNGMRTGGNGNSNAPGEQPGVTKAPTSVSFMVSFQKAEQTHREIMPDGKLGSATQFIHDTRGAK